MQALEDVVERPAVSFSRERLTSLEILDRYFIIVDIFVKVQNTAVAQAASVFLIWACQYFAQADTRKLHITLCFGPGQSSC